MMRSLFSPVAVVVIVALGLGIGASARADTTLRVGKAFAGVFDFAPLDVGIAKGFFKQHGLDIQESSFGGSARLQQALAADAVDIGLGSGPELAFVARGAPVMGVAAFMGPPDGLVIVVRKISPIESVSGLKDHMISVSTVGSLTEWLVRKLAEQQGWGAEGIQLAYLGDATAQIAAMRDGETDGMVSDIVKANVLEQKGIGRILVSLGDVAPNFITHVVYARKALIAAHPDEVRAFLAGWFESVAYMRDHKAESVAIAAQVMHEPDALVAKAYDVTMPALSADGRFKPKALAVLKRSFLEMALLPTAPDMSALYTEKYLPSSTAVAAVAPR